MNNKCNLIVKTETILKIDLSNEKITSNVKTQRNRT